MGNVQWQKDFGGVHNDTRATVNVASDGHLFVAFAYAFSEPYPDVPLAKLNIIKLDISGNIIWDKKVGPIRYILQMYGFYELPNRNIVTAGYHSPPTGASPGTIFMLSSTGDSLWMRDYKRAIYNGHNNLYNIKQTSDNGLIACGEVFGAFEPPYAQNMWLLKLDSMGCLEPNCDGVIIVEPYQKNNDNILKVFPNPAQNKITISLNGYQRLEGLDLFICNIQGQLLLQQTLPLNNFAIDISGLEAGVYIAKIKLSDGGFVQERFVVVR
jgi:hypothetical protein